MKPYKIDAANPIWLIGSEASPFIGQNTTKKVN
jgi:hypothetical protein